MDELLTRMVLADEQRNAVRPDLTRIRYVYRPAGVLEWDGRQVPYRECWQAVERAEPGDVVRTWYPDQATTGAGATDG